MTSQMNYEDAMKIDTYQTKYESIHKAQDEVWNDSKYFESIQHKSERFHDTIHDYFESIQGC